MFRRSAYTGVHARLQCPLSKVHDLAHLPCLTRNLLLLLWSLLLLMRRNTLEEDTQ
jgi:hypothetical protein